MVFVCMRLAVFTRIRVCKCMRECTRLAVCKRKRV